MRAFLRDEQRRSSFWSDFALLLDVVTRRVKSAKFNINACAFNSLMSLSFNATL